MTTEDIKLKAFELHHMANKLYAGQPYSFHLEMVYDFYKKYERYLTTEQRIIVENALWFHDVEEDCGMSYHEISKIIGEESADIVFNVTNEQGKSRKEKILKTLYKTSTAYESIFLKLCDRLANMTFSFTEKLKNEQSDMYDTYVNEYYVLRYTLNRNGWFKDMWVELDSLAGYYKGIIYPNKNYIEHLVKERSELWDMYQKSFDPSIGEYGDYAIPEPKEIDILGDRIYKMVKAKSDQLPFDFIIETLTSLGQAPNLLYDDNGHFCLTSESFQSVSAGDEPSDTEINIFVSKHQWKNNIKDALKEYLKD
jgi:hypothetical protein